MKRLVLILCSLSLFSIAIAEDTTSSAKVKSAATSTEDKSASATSEDKVKETSSKAKQIKKKKTIRKTVTVEWYQPETGVTKAKKRTRVIISGKTFPNSKVYIPKKVIPIITKKKKIRYFKRSKALVSKKISKSNADGYFEIHLNLPYAQVQLPIKIVPPKNKGKRVGKSKKFTLNLKIKKGEEVKVASKGPLKTSPAFEKKHAVWLGSGFNFLQFSQKRTVTNDTSDSDLSFQTFKAPSIFLKGWWKFNQQWDAIFAYKSSPGSATSADGIIVSNGSYTWDIIALESTYFPKSWYGNFLNMSSKAGLRFGVQSHAVPFITYVSTVANVSRTYEIKKNNVTMLTLGGYWLLESRKWGYEVFMRYQQALSVGSLFEIVPSIAFDGSLGAFYKFKNNWRVGSFWYGQYHKYDYTSTRIDSEDVNGEMSLFFSNLELRVGYTF
ncbi:MAG: hypothetical protein HOO06_06660 [Bdellovibrionaceae bacterium]|jgi:hypothetical protein|nr:hypothetical protein [Pseudobdellovibrionaceae bacterium]